MLLDAHTHTHFAAYEKDSKEVIDRALKAGVWIVNVGTQKDTSTQGVAIAHQYEKGVYASVGLHPIHTEQSFHDKQELGASEEAKGFYSRGEEFDYSYYKKLAVDPKVVAIGECGLDYYRISPETKEKQAQIFLQQADLAQEVGKALMIHCRPSKGTENAYEDLLGLMANTKYTIPKIVHFYVGGLEITKKLVAAGFYFTIGGVITFARDYDESIRFMPLDRILTETDAPYVAPAAYRGKRNEPIYIVETVKKLAELKGISYEQAAQATFENACKVFKI